MRGRERFRFGDRAPLALTAGLVMLAWFFAAAAFAATPLSTQLVSAHNPLVPRPVGGNGDSAAPYTTPDGRFVLFCSRRL